MKNIDIDFQVLTTHDPKNIIILDNSNWSYIEEEPSVLEVVPPGFSKSIAIWYQKNTYNRINTRILKLNFDKDCHTDLPDGIYRFLLKGSPDKFRKEKYYLKTDSFQCRFDEYIAGKVKEEGNIRLEVLDNIKLIEGYITAAASNTRIGNFKLAEKLFMKADDILNTSIKNEYTKCKKY